MIALWVGLELTLYGMGLVFLLLAILWGVIALMTRLESGSENEASTPLPSSAAARAPSPIAPDLLAAIVIACRAHRMSRRKQAAPEMRTHEPGSLPSRWVGTGRTRQNRSWAPRGRHS